MLRPEIREMKRLVGAGALGKISLARVRSSHGGPEYFQYRDHDPSWFHQEGAGPLLDMGVHGLTMITGILGPARAVSCLAGISEAVRPVRSGAFDGKEIHTGVPDNYLITLDFGNASFAVVDSSYCVKAANGPSMEIFGSKGSLSVGSPGGERAGGPPFEIYLDDAEHGVRGWMSPMTRLDRAKQAVGVEDLVGAIRDGREPVLTAAHARHVLEIMNACPVAARDGRTRFAEFCSVAFMGRMVVGALAWLWTRVFTERVRVRTMWLLNEKVAVRVVGIVRGPDGAILMVADPAGRWTLPGVPLGRLDQPQSRLRDHLQGTHGIGARNWRPVSARRSRHAGLECIYTCDVASWDPRTNAAVAMKFMTVSNLDPSVDDASSDIISFIGSGNRLGAVDG
jgi:hypothetical protein